MPEYIERDLVLAFCEDEREEGGSDIRTIINRVRNAKAADVAPVVHGRWIFVAQRFVDGGVVDIYRCSECSIPDGKRYRYYPNCGARMDGE